MDHFEALRYFIHLAYNGQNFHGWQRQDNVPSIQGRLEDALALLLRKKVPIVGCGRTDKGVHASHYVAHFDCDDLPQIDVCRKLNGIIKKDIICYSLTKVEGKMHAQRSALSRTYDYLVHWNKSPFLNGFSSMYHGPPLDLSMMLAFAKYISMQNDFKHLCKQPEIYENTGCRIDAINLWVNEEEGRMRLQVQANRFLRSMMRILMNQLIQVGNGQRTLDQLIESFETGKREHPLQAFYPDGLYLSHVEYPQVNFEKRPLQHPFLNMDSEDGWDLMR